PRRSRAVKPKGRVVLVCRRRVEFSHMRGHELVEVHRVPGRSAHREDSDTLAVSSKRGTNLVDGSQPNDRGPRPAVVVEVGELLRAVERIHQHGYGANPYRPEKRRDEGGAVVQRDENPLLATNSERPQGTTESAHRLKQPTVRDFLVPVPDRDLV